MPRRLKDCTDGKFITEKYLVSLACAGACHHCACQPGLGTGIPGEAGALDRALRGGRYIGFSRPVHQPEARGSLGPKRAGRQPRGSCRQPRHGRRRQVAAGWIHDSAGGQHVCHESERLPETRFPCPRSASSSHSPKSVPASSISARAEAARAAISRQSSSRRWRGYQ